MFVTASERVDAKSKIWSVIGSVDTAYLGMHAADVKKDIDKNIQQRGFAGRHRPNY
jgi:hypothetical protein